MLGTDARAKIERDFSRNLVNKNKLLKNIASDVIYLEDGPEKIQEPV